MEALNQHILQILSTQSEGYLCPSNASAFAAAGLNDEEANEAALLEMLDEGLVELVIEETDYEKDKLVPVEGTEDQFTVEKETWSEETDRGWVLTAKGRKAI